MFDPVSATTNELGLRTSSKAGRQRTTPGSLTPNITLPWSKHRRLTYCTSVEELKASSPPVSLPEPASSESSASGSTLRLNSVNRGEFRAACGYCMYTSQPESADPRVPEEKKTELVHATSSAQLTPACLDRQQIAKLVTLAALHQHMVHTSQPAVGNAGKGR